VIEGIDIVFLHARNSKATAKWYRETLGLSIAFQTPDLSWQEFDMLGGPSARFAIEQASGDMSEVELQKIMISFRVNDIKAAVRSLEEKGVTFYGNPKIREEGKSLYATLRDPEDNWIQLSQRTG
jgi:extradiol dioxygenase family protein